MKKKLTLILALILCFSLVGCGEKKGDISEIKDKGKLVVGITDFEPMDYKDDSGNWIGFDADMATKFAERLGVDVEFVEIDWDNKALELDAKTIDCVWNGMTITEEAQNTMDCSSEYFNNSQVVIVPKEKEKYYTDIEKMNGITFAVEQGSAGEEQAIEKGLAHTAVKDQALALQQVASGQAEAAIVDYLMAAAMTGEGTKYANLSHTVRLNDEKYGVGFRVGSDLTEELNTFFKECYEDGTMKEIADKYNIGDSLVEQK